MMSSQTDDVIDQLLDDYGRDGEDVLGQGGLVQALTKRIVERALEGELTHHLGYEHNDPDGNNSGNSRNGATPKTVHTEYGSVDVDTPRDRDGSFEPQMIPKHQTTLEGLADKVMALYGGGMTVRDIRDQLAELYGVDVSRDWISSVERHEALCDRAVVKGHRLRPVAAGR